MTVKALDWTQGDVGHVSVALRGGYCRIEWGDGHTSSIKAHPYEVLSQHVSHVYPSRCKKSGDVFEVVISSSGDNIMSFDTGCIDMAICEVDLSKCPELERLHLTGPVNKIDTRFNKSLKKLSIQNAYEMSLDLSQNQALEQIEIRGYDSRRLDISRCDRLWYLDCGSSKMQEIAVSNNSELKEVIFWYDCPLNDKSLRFIKRTVERNNGSISIIVY